MGHLMLQIEQGKGVDEFDNGELHGIIWFVEEKMEDIQKRIDLFHLLPQGDLATQTVGSRYKPLILNQWFTNMVNNNEHTCGDIVAQDNLGLLPGHKLGGKSDAREPLYGDLRGTTTNIGKQLLGFTPFGGGTIEMELPHSQSHEKEVKVNEKTSDLIILYGGHVYHVIYRPDESEPMIWSSHDEVQQKLDEYRKTPKLDRLKKMVNKETYLKERITKAKAQ
ncbi:hypothetical protein Gotri_019851 [Gossypium trilobum]|uniref:Uncharacterized protein n=1 Tax=Gossypium trilobum TaxID=34281 RepID=A0A7J9EED1_9ROSI|nr:hypothetical protein [Gossypium trilobum]